MSHVYISYGPDDLDTVLEIHEALRREAVPVWYRPPGEAAAPPEAMADRMDEAAAVILILSATSQRAPEVEFEIGYALDRGIALIPWHADRARLTGRFRSQAGPHLRHRSGEPGALAALAAEAKGRYRGRCPVISVMNLKGGVGKTTVTAQVFGAWQAAHGNRVLLVDLDPQYNLTQVFFDMDEADDRSALDRSAISLFERSRVHAADAPSPGADWSALMTLPFTPPPPGVLTVDLFGEDAPPGRIDLVSGQFELSKYAFANDPAGLAIIRENFLRMVDHYRSQYDLIVFDTNPNATFLTRCCLEAADRVLSPMQPDIYSLRGVRLLNQVLNDQVAPERRPALSVLFNAVPTREQTVFEADARNGVHDGAAGFALSKRLLGAALPRSGHLVIRERNPEAPRWKQLVIHSGRGGGLKAIRDSLDAIARELADQVAG